jgi:hypothetical protein
MSYMLAGSESGEWLTAAHLLHLWKERKAESAGTRVMIIATRYRGDRCLDEWSL